MQGMKIEDTIKHIQQLHFGQIDKSGMPYWYHPVAVMNKVRDWKTLYPFFGDDDLRIALLHDVIEDCSGKDWEYGKWLIREYSDYVIEGVMLLTRINGQFLAHDTEKLTSGTYMDYIQNIVQSLHFGAIVTKYADNLHNSDPERIALVPEGRERNIVESMARGRYAESKLVLAAKLKEWRMPVKVLPDLPGKAASISTTQETCQKKGYHVANIPKGVIGEASKVVEETAEFIDAVSQQNDVMALVELSDLYGAMEAFLEKHHPTIQMSNLKVMSDVTKRVFKNGYRK
jgi:phosphoribosyl-ATP pyrophosphohydrolase